MHFVLLQPIHLSANASIPTGSTGTISNYDAHHLQLTFDVFHKCLSYWDNTLILDKHDTDDETWAAIELFKMTHTFDLGRVQCERAAPENIFENCT